MLWPKMRDRPRRCPLEKSPPIGMTANVRNAGTSDRNGASLNTGPVGPVGDQVLLEEDLDAVGQASAGCPNGPARLGPMRFCMSPMILRSNQIISIVATSRNTNVITTLTSTMSDDREVDLAGEERVGGEHH